MIGRPRVHHRLTDSTNQRARELASLGAPHGTLVTADEQTAGRGRQGREWVAAPGAGPEVGDGGQVGEQVLCLGWLERISVAQDGQAGWDRG